MKVTNFVVNLWPFEGNVEGKCQVVVVFVHHLTLLAPVSRKPCACSNVPPASSCLKYFDVWRIIDIETAVGAQKLFFFFFALATF